MGDKGVMAVADDLGEGMQCSDHPYRRNPGGICAFCLQEKLGKLVSSSNSTNPSFFPPLPLSSSSNSSSPSFRRDFGSDAAAAGAGRNKIPFISAAHKKKNNISSNGGGGGGGVLVLKRSKSVAPKPAGEIGVGVGVGIAEDSPRRKKSFWSFFYLSSSTATATNHCSSGSIRRSTDVQINQLQQQEEDAAADDESSVKNATTEHEVESPGGGSQTSSSSFGRKVARSRSVGCGSRSFSGDFLERISTGLGDCTLRRVESHREPNKSGGNGSKMVIHRDHEHRIKDTVKCGGIFGGLGMISSSYWLAAAAADAEDFGSTSSRMSSSARAASRSRSWGWALASPMRAFRPVSGSKSLAPANAVASINSSTGVRIGNGNPSSLSVGG